MSEADRERALQETTVERWQGCAAGTGVELWSIQGANRTWFCGAYFGHGFHEDGLQAGLAVAEHLSDWRRPWHLDNPSDRIHAPLAMREPAR